jgi:ribosomal protein S27AE
MKHCNTCNTDKEESEFHIRKASKDGLAAKCKQCAKKYDDARANLPHRVSARLQYSKTENYRLSHNAANHKWEKSNQKKKSASCSVNNAVRDHKIEKPTHCSECNTETQLHGHHDDYNKPLEVRWLCSKCHRAWHKEHGEAKNAA